MSLFTYIIGVVVLIVVLSLLSDAFSLLLYASFLYFVTAYSNEIFLDAAGSGIQDWIYAFPAIIGTVAIVKMVYVLKSPPGGQ